MNIFRGHGILKAPNLLEPGKMPLGVRQKMRYVILAEPK
jgi:hypothetical protein